MHQNKWPDDAQPEWPEPASGTTQSAAVAGERTQAFPETSRTEVLASGGSAAEEADRDTADRHTSGDTFGKTDGPEDPAAISDPWGDNHDPHEVTVQLDSVAVGDGNRLVGRVEGTPDGTDGPVFVDESGRRSRRYRRIGIVVGISCAIYAVVIVVTLLSGNSNAPWLPVPGRGDGKEAGQVENSPLPRDTAAPSGTGTGTVVPPGVSAGTTPSPGASAATPRASATAKAPGNSATPQPTATKTTPGPGPGTNTTPPPSGTPDPPTSVTPSPSPPTVDPSPTPSAPPPAGGSGDGGTGTVADGTNDNPPGDAGTQPTETTV